MRGLFASLVVLLTACGGAAPAVSSPTAAPTTAATTAPAPTAAARTAAPTAPPQPVVVNAGMSSNILNVAFFVGVEKGIYIKHGIDLKINTVSTGRDSIQGMQAGKYHFTSSSWATILPSVEQGVPFKLFAPITGNPNIGNFDNQVSLIVRPDVGKPVNTLADVKGLTIGVALNTGPELWLRSHLKSVGIDPDKDVKFVNVSYPNMLSVMQSKGVHAVVPAEPQGLLVLKGIPGSKVVVRGGGKADVRVNMVALDTWLKSDPAVIDRLLAAHAESSQYVRLHLDDAVTAATHYISGSGLDAALLKEAIKLIEYDPRWSDKVYDSFVQASADMIANGQMKSAPKADAVLALDILRGINTKNAQYFSDVK